MPSIDELNQRFAIGNIARFEAGGGGLTRLVLNGGGGGGGEAHVYLHGAHVSHYKPKGGQPVLFTSARSNYQSGKPIRGGVPIIFPWFGPRLDDANAPMHGIVRTREWALASVAEEGNAVRAVMTLASDEQSRAAWPHDFHLRFTAIVAASLTMELEVRNTSGQPFTCEEALHTYFSVGDVCAIAIDGLAGTEYLDKEKGGGRFRQQETQLKLTGPTDRVYVNTAATCVIEDTANRRRISIAKEQSASTVVWNPWPEKIKTMADLDPTDWTKYVCIETCNVKENALTLAAGQAHTMRATISIA
jgi:glucose-6-phosphate 1-epimerase